MPRIIDFLDSSPPYLLAIAAVICFALIIYFSYQDRIKVAGLLSGLFLLCVLMAYFPQLESIKAFAVDVKLRKSLDRAEEILERMKGLAIINAKMSYVILAWQNRLGSASAKQKQALLDEFDQILSGLKVSPDIRNEIVYPYVQLIGLDLYSIFGHILERHVELKKAKIMSQSSQAQQSKSAFVGDEAEWRTINANGPYENLTDYDLDFYLRRMIPQRLFDIREQEIASAFRKDILNMYYECKRKGGLTTKAAEFLDRYQELKSIDDKEYELFGESIDHSQ